ncbi:hypothetical protein NPIL_73581 [Nephila pilipes]|uniref:RIIa domain-containing protein n=1 Tax=Nephila pilipes TaxID=299642 RepID=A0A8X6QDZ1_NEPPI|nr:hypothetical protein NPIL_73581 [Nephila pilipes]
MSVTRPRPVVPEELPKLLHSISYAVIKNQPHDIISFAAEHFKQLYEDRERQREISGNTDSKHDPTQSFFSILFNRPLVGCVAPDML